MIHNVKNYGAKGDGETDDTKAINSALYSSSEGDEVYFPYTRDGYLVTSNSREAIGFHRCDDNVTVRGEIGATGEGPRIKMGNVPTGDVPNKWTGGIDASRSDPVVGLLIENITFSGNRSVNRDLDGYNVAAFNIYDGDSGWDVEIRNCIFEEAGGKGLSTAGGFSKVRFENITCRNNDRHGFNPNGSGSGSKNRPDIVAKNVLLIDNGYKGHGTGMDVSAGYIEMENVYGDGNTQGYKIGQSGGQPDYFRISNANLRNSEVNSGWRETSGGDNGLSGSTIKMENVQFIGAWLDGVRFTDAATYEVTELLIDDANRSSGNRWGLRVGDTAKVSIDTLRVQNTNNNEGIFNNSIEEVSIGTYYHYNNEQGGVNDKTGTLNINREIEEESSNLDVPNLGEVGAFSGSNRIVKIAGEPNFALYGDAGSIESTLKNDSNTKDYTATVVLNVSVKGDVIYSDRKDWNIDAGEEKMIKYTFKHNIPAGDTVEACIFVDNIT